MTKMGSAALAMAVVVMLMLGTVLRGAKAQAISHCLSSEVAPVHDANAVVQQLRLTTGKCCQTSNNFCSVVLKIGGAAAIVCGSRGYCPNCDDVGDGLQLVVAQCVRNGAVGGACSPDGTEGHFYYITSSTNHP